MPAITHRSTREPAIKSRFLSHGTLKITDVTATRRFYEEVLGLEVVQPMMAALYVRLGGDHTYVCVESSRTVPTCRSCTTTASTSAATRRSTRRTRASRRWPTSTA